MKTTGFAAVLLLVAAATADDVDDENFAPSVEFWGTAVTVRCPPGSPTLQKKDEEGISFEREGEYVKITMTEKELSGEYRCMEGADVRYRYYIRGRGCETCFELSGVFAAVTLGGDVLLTGLVMVLVFLWARGKAPAAPPPGRPKTTRPAARNAPLPPNPDYEPLNTATRSKDVYGQLHSQTG